MGHEGLSDQKTFVFLVRLGMPCTLAEFERGVISERTRAGLKAARARGRKGGRPRRMTASKIRMTMAAMADPDARPKDIARELGVTTHHALRPRQRRRLAQSRCRGGAAHASPALAHCPALSRKRPGCGRRRRSPWAKRCANFRHQRRTVS